jgi:hypothetical protein
MMKTLLRPLLMAILRIMADASVMMAYIATWIANYLKDDVK